MKKTIISLTYMAISMMAITSCGVISRAGGVGTGTGVNIKSWSDNRYDLVPSGDRITYTIDISTPEGKQKLHNISLSEAQRLAETEATRKFNCDRLIDPRFDYLKKGKRILRITVDGRPGVYKPRD
ncbi:MAG: hypothetical protein J6I61_01040 [Prevotella sp.]|nr:hypothetical protein [Prevotella sp.]